jgi:hypothetical protein
MRRERIDQRTARTRIPGSPTWCTAVCQR